jgi:hypothetical protein
MSLAAPPAPSQATPHEAGSHANGTLVEEVR